ncbi:MAG: RHS repeat-associated core domain-containing protein, partial [Acidobacteriota bacterium]
GESRSSSPGDDRENFATYSRDSLSGLDYADQRYYAPSLGRFLTPDPYAGSFKAGMPTSAHRYSYASGDPANGFDPSGLDTEGPARFEWCPLLDLVVPIDFCRFAGNIGSIFSNLPPNPTVDTGRIRQAEFEKAQKQLYAERDDCYKDSEAIHNRELARIGPGPKIPNMRSVVIGVLSTAAVPIFVPGTPETKALAFAYTALNNISSYFLKERPELIEKWESDTGQKFSVFLDLLTAETHRKIDFDNNCNYAADRALRLLYQAYRP